MQISTIMEKDDDSPIVYTLAVDSCDVKPPDIYKACCLDRSSELADSFPSKATVDHSQIKPKC